MLFRIFGVEQLSLAAIVTLLVQSGINVLPVANLMADSESGAPTSCSHVIVTAALSRLVSEIFACDIYG